MRLDFFREHVMRQFQTLLSFHQHAEAQLQESYPINRSMIAEEQRPSKLSGDDLQEWLSLHEQEIQECEYQYTILFPQVMRYAVVVMCYTLVESNLSRIAQQMRQRKELDLNLTDLQAKDLHKRFKKFWTRVAKLDWWEDSRWDRLKDLEQLRNCIAHRNGMLLENEKRVHELIARRAGVARVTAAGPLVDPDDLGKVVLEERFCRETIDQLRVLFGEMFDRAGCFGPQWRGTKG